MNHTGKKPATYSGKDLRYNAVRPKNLSISLPRTWGHGFDFGQSNWLMLGNGPQDDNSFPSNWSAAQGCGDCAWAGPGHEEMQSAHEAGRPIPRFSGATIVAQYSAYSGYNSQTGANDTGSNVRDVLNWRQTKGLTDNQGNVYKIGAFVSLELGNWQELEEASYLFESVGLGFRFPTSAMDQFDNDQRWSVVPGAQIEGGHYVPIVGRAASTLWTCITWGRRQLLTSQFLSTYADEIWAYVDPLRYNQVTGETAEHWKDYDLEKFIALVSKPQSFITRIRKVFPR